MNHKFVLSACALLAGTLFLTAYSPQAVQKVTLQEALDLGLVEADFKSTGGHSGFCAEATLTNLDSRPLQISVEPGRRLVSTNSENQDILVTREQPVILASGEQKKTAIYGFCSQLNNESPEHGDGFTAGRVVSGDTLALAQYLHKNPAPEGSMQQSVWTLTDENAISSIHHADRDSIENLVHFMARLLKQPVPKYSMEYEEDEDEIITDRAMVLHPHFVWREQFATNVHIVLYDRFGRSIKRSWVEVPMNSSGQEFTGTIEVDDLPPGRYFVKAYDSSINLIEEMDVRI